MLLTMAKIVFQMVALGFEGIIIFVLDLPSSPARDPDFHHRLVGNPMIRRPGIVMNDLAIGTRNLQFTPVDENRIVASAQRHLIEIAIGEGFLDLAVPPFVYDRRQCDSR